LCNLAVFFGHLPEVQDGLFWKLLNLKSSCWYLFLKEISMDLVKRNIMIARGNGTCPMMFAHGFGCGQNIWRFITPLFEQAYKIILLDYIVAGKFDLNSYDPGKSAYN